MVSLSFSLLCVIAGTFCAKTKHSRFFTANIVLCAVILVGIYVVDSSEDHSVEIHTTIARYAFMPTMFNNATLFERNRYNRNNVNIVRGKY